MEDAVTTETDHSLQRKAAIAWGCTDHRGTVTVKPLPDFDLDNTIFSTLEGVLPRVVIKAKIANDVTWTVEAAQKIEAAYEEAQGVSAVPAVDPALLNFMHNECDFSMEHADGTFLEHLLFCHEYSFRHYSQHSPVVLLLHSILGTATNTFAMEAKKIPMLAELLTDFEMLHVDAFPSILRLLNDLRLLEELEANLHRLDKLRTVTFHRVIDNGPMEMDAESFWIQLNFQLIHFVDFLPAANWTCHSSDPVIQSFVALSSFLDKTGKREAKVDFQIPAAAQPREGETLSLGGRFSALVPAPVKRKLAAKSIRKFSARIGHSLDFGLEWAE
jgi:hypothetical protein